MTTIRRTAGTARADAATAAQYGRFPAAALVAMLIGCALSFSTVGRAQDIIGSAHDFSSLAWSSGRMCTVCHIPQGEWSHKPSTRVYTLSDSPTLDALDFGQPSGVSLKCLGCHDGTIPLDSFAGMAGETYIPPAAQIGPDLSTHHPVSFTYNSALAAVDGGIYDPSTRDSGLGGTIAERMLGDGVKLECTTCHDVHAIGRNWKLLVKPADGGALCITCHRVGAGPPNDHTVLKGGFAEHKPGFGNPIANNCTPCHGPNLDDGFAPSCFTCHGQIWAGEGPPADHTELKGGFADHRPGFGNPIDNGCTQCHGPNLDDGFAPSCFMCHDRIWAGAGPPANHTELKGGFADHKPGFGNPIDNGCTQCHGPNLDDGFAPSCFMCHDRIWAGAGPPANHTELKGGFADHKPGLGNPIDNGCTQCHGPNLDDGFAPSCFTCHGQIWAGGGPPVDHTELKGGFADHRPGFETPIGSGCTQCHGPNLDDGFAPSCFMCHNQLWQDEEPPVETGDTWHVKAPLPMADFTVTFTEFEEFLLAESTYPGQETIFGMGVELDGLIFWANLSGEIFFGTIDRDNQVMKGVQFRYPESGGIWFAEQL